MAEEAKAGQQSYFSKSLRNEQHRQSNAVHCAKGQAVNPDGGHVQSIGLHPSRADRKQTLSAKIENTVPSETVREHEEGEPEFVPSRFAEIRNRTRLVDDLGIELRNFDNIPRVITKPPSHLRLPKALPALGALKNPASTERRGRTAKRKAIIVSI